jgi:hypothetical protein
VLLKNFEDQHGPFVSDARDDLAHELFYFGVDFRWRRFSRGLVPCGWPPRSSTCWRSFHPELFPLSAELVRHQQVPTSQKRVYSIRLQTRRAKS